VVIGQARPDRPRGARRLALLVWAGVLLAALAAVGLARHLELTIGLSLGLAALALACWVGVASGLRRLAERAEAPTASASATADTTAPTALGLSAADWERQLLAGLPGRSFVVQPVREGLLTDWLVLASHDADPSAPPQDSGAAPELLSHWLARHPQHRPTDVVQALQSAPRAQSPSARSPSTPATSWRALPLVDAHRLLWLPGATTAAASASPITPTPAAPLPALNDRESIAYTVSHDLRAPIRVIEGFTRIVREDYGHLLDRIGNDHLDRVLGAATRMNGMIDALLALSKLSTQPLVREAVSLSALAGQIVEELRAQAPLRMVQVVIAPELVAQGDPGQLRTALENLLGNAWKYTARKPEAHIEFSATRLSRFKPDITPAQDRTVYCLRDNGAGFDPRFAERLFGAFQRLHSASEFAGTGVGLASVRRIVTRHGGEIWADAAVDQGACFYFTLGAG
jgi:Histidine kinase-, DNA gyrase B-, and HSP90-like ATPase/His Kinase A (phospho-acceptor) domain